VIATGNEPDPSGDSRWTAESSCGSRQIDLERVPLKDPELEEPLSFMGMSSRQPITGRIWTPDQPGFQDFAIVDLYQRKSLPSDLDLLMKDPYLFKPVPMLTRTWIYHETLHKVTKKFDENGMIKDALCEVCTDCDVNHGQWSPVMALLVMAMGASFTADLFIFGITVCMTTIMMAVTVAMNNMRWYCLVRGTTFLPRLAFYILVAMWLTGSDLNGVGVVGFAFSAVCALVDLGRGDLARLMMRQLNCRWEIVHCLPNRVYVCYRTGAAVYEKWYGSRGGVSELVCGFSPWTKEHGLIADFHGILLELRPMTKEDWNAVYEASFGYDQEFTVLAMNVFNHVLPSLSSIWEAEERRRQADQELQEQRNRAKAIQEVGKKKTRGAD